MYVCMYEIKVYRSRLYKMPKGVHAVLPMMRNSLLCCWACNISISGPAARSKIDGFIEPSGVCMCIKLYVEKL